MAQLESMENSVSNMDMVTTQNSLTAMGRAVINNRRATKTQAISKKIIITMGISLFIFLVSYILFQTIEIYSVQNSISITEAKILELDRSIQASNVQLLKSSNFDDAKRAVAQTNFKVRDNNKALSVDLSKDNFPENKIKENKNEGIVVKFASLFR